jgi:hypothetical protein
MCRVVPYAAAGELVHALADARGTFLVGEQGQIRIQVLSPSLSSHRLDSLPSRSARRERVLVRWSRRLYRLKKYGEDDSTAIMIIPRTSERNSSLPIAPPVPSLPLPSYFASHPGACSPLQACLACLHASPQGTNSIKKSCSSLIRCATADPGISRERRNKKPTNTDPGPILTSSCSSYTPSYKRPNGGGHQSSMLSSIAAVVSNAR